ncbi:MAG: hypothetical protein HZB26_23095 [Candidatus Hydrogenedentes bacterium]|nr:hypothetical protein [Candidatus Hydrogenedentota bacterium]
MFEEVDKAAATLADTKAGWVTRRDAVETLGGNASRAIAALQRHAEESDVDVRAAAQKELARAKSSLQAVKADAKACSLEDLVRGLAKDGERTVTRADRGFAVDVRFKSGRTQRVYVAPHEIREGYPLVRVITYCGKPKDEAFEWALQANLKMIHGSIALEEERGEKRLVIVTCFLASEATPLEVRSAVKEIAYYGDWIESKLSGKDEL